MLKKISLITFCFFSVSIFNTVLASDWRASKEFYIKLFGQYQDDKLANQARSVFQKILPVINKARNKAPELVIIDSKGWPWAIALPDNSIVLSKGALQVCYQDVDKSLGDIRLAMILGHELSHISEDDYWYRDTYVALEHNKNMQDKTVFRFIAERSGLTQKDKDWLNAVRDRELRADDKGFIYAALAGYDVSKLISNDEQNFFEFWKKQTQLEGAQTHASAKERAAFIKARFEQLSALVEAYNLGLVLLHFNFVDEAEKVYRQILDKLPAAEVYNNLGYVYLLRSGYFEQNPQQLFFWLPNLVDSSPQTKILTRGKSSASGINMDMLEKAAEFLEAAIEQRPDYYTANLNLASVYFIQGKFDAAIALLKELKNHQDKPEMLSILALARYFSVKDTIDIGEITVDKLIRIQSGYANRPDFLFNLARFLELKGEADKALKYWKKLTDFQHLPKVYANVVSVKTEYLMNTDEIANSEEIIEKWANEHLSDTKILKQSELIQGSIEKRQYKNFVEYIINGVSVIKAFTMAQPDLPKKLQAKTVSYQFDNVSLKTLPIHEPTFLVLRNEDNSRFFIKQKRRLLNQ